MCPADNAVFFADESRRGAARRLIHRYEAIAMASRCMLTAARCGDWNEVARLEDRCRALIAELKAAAAFEQLAEDDQRVRLRLLRNILADDAEVRVRAEPWLAQLEHLIGPAGPRKVADG
jgi:flagellar protein FliT